MDLLQSRTAWSFVEGRLLVTWFRTWTGVKWEQPVMCTIKIFMGGGGGRGGDSAPSPYEEFLSLPTPYFKMFWEDSLMTPPPPPQFKLLSLFPHPIHHPCSCFWLKFPFRHFWKENKNYSSAPNYKSMSFEMAHLQGVGIFCSHVCVIQMTLHVKGAERGNLWLVRKRIQIDGYTFKKLFLLPSA